MVRQIDGPGTETDLIVFVALSSTSRSAHIPRPLQGVAKGGEILSSFGFELEAISRRERSVSLLPKS
jgi:hypothetical protein